MPTQVTAWSAIEIEMSEDLKTFSFIRVLSRGNLRQDMAEPGLQPTFVFFTSAGAHIFVNDKGSFLLRFTGNTKGLKSVHARLAAAISKPRLYKLTSKSPLGRLAKKAIKQLFGSGKLW